MTHSTASPLIPRSCLMEATGFSAPKISPDGTRIAFLAPHHGARNVWIAPATDASAAVPLTEDRTSAIRDLCWAETNQHLILIRDASGAERTQIASIELSSRRTVALSPCPGAQNRLVALSIRFADEVLIEANERDPAFFDVYRVNIRTGRAELVLRNDRFTWIYADHLLRLRLAELRLKDGSVSYQTPGTDGRWRTLIQVPSQDEITRPFRIYETGSAFSDDALEIYAMDCRGRDTAALAAWNLATGEARILAADPRADITAILLDPLSHRVLAYTTEHVRPQTNCLDATTAADLERLRTDADLQVDVLSQSRDNRRWIVSHSAPHCAARFALFDRDTREQTPLYCQRPDLEGVTLAKMHAQVLKSRDGLDLVCYLTLPAEHESGASAPRPPLPLVALVHGGPWIRDSYALDPWVQLMANRGYAVLNVNFRGSRGLGKTFLNAGDREWGGRIVDDIADAVTVCVERGIADAQNVALMGASFGGYTTLMGLARYPELFKCGIDMFGVTNLESFLDTIPPHWKALTRMWQQRVGDWTTAQGRAALRECSPLHNVERISAPVLVAQGGNDPRVVQAESDQMVAALERHGVEVTYLLYPEEGHGFVQIDNQMSFFAAVEEFLARHLGGRREPPGAGFARARVIIASGAAHLPGLPRAGTARASTS